jgi:hypothetical protein
VVTDPLVKLAPWGHLLALGRSTGAGLHEAEILNDRGQLAFAGQREVKERSIKRHRIKIEDRRSSDSAFTASDLHVKSDARTVRNTREVILDLQRLLGGSRRPSRHTPAGRARGEQARADLWQQDDARGAVVNRDALHEDRQLRHSRKPLNVFPGQCCFKERGDVSRQPRSR